MASVAVMAASTAIAGGAQAYSVVQQREASQEQRSAARQERRRAALQNARERRRAAAQAQVQRSQVEAGSAAMGGVTGTGTGQAIGAIESQTSGNISFQRGMEGMQSNILRSQQRAQDRLGRAQMGQAVASLPSQFGLGPRDLFRQGIGQS